MCHKKKKKEKKKGKKKSGKGKRKVRWRGRLQETRWGVFLVVYCFFFFFFSILCPGKDFLLHKRGNRGKLFLKITSLASEADPLWGLSGLMDQPVPRAQPLHPSASHSMAAHRSGAEPTIPLFSLPRAFHSPCTEHI